MTRIALAAAFAASLMASSASAATYVAAWTTSPTGAVSVVFGDDGMDIPGAGSVPGESTSTHDYTAATGDFTDTFSFMLPNGIVGFTLSSIGFATNSSLSLSSFTFNGANIAFTNTPNSSGGMTVAGSGGPYTVTAGSAQTLTISGNSGPDAVFSGTATFEPRAVVPEPAAWALMILGFAGTGAILRRRRLIAA